MNIKKMHQLQQDKEALLNTPLFRGIEEPFIDRIMDSGEVEIISFDSGSIISSVHQYSKQLGILLEGRAEVSKVKPDGHKVMMSILSVSQLFGAATLFNDFDYYVTEITAKGKCRAAIFTEEVLKKLFKQEFRLVENYLGYLAERIYFLNKKIDAFTGTNAESKLCMYLLENAEQEDENYAVKLLLSYEALAKTLDVGRASLYRAMDALEAEGLIVREFKVIRIADLQRLQSKI